AVLVEGVGAAAGRGAEGDASDPERSEQVAAGAVDGHGCSPREGRAGGRDGGAGRRDRCRSGRRGGHGAVAPGGLVIRWVSRRARSSTSARTITSSEPAIICG